MDRTPQDTTPRVTWTPIHHGKPLYHADYYESATWAIRVNGTRSYVQISLKQPEQVAKEDGQKLLRLISMLKRQNIHYNTYYDGDF